MIRGNALVILLTNPVITTDLDEEDTSISTPMLDTSFEAIQSQYQMMPILAMMHGATAMTGLAYGKPAQEFWPLLAQVPALPRASTLQCHR